MKKIKVTNFRKVKESCELELGPITFFTGTNNSGKSTILKALMILSDYGSSNNHLELNFRGDNKWAHKIDCYQNAVNWSNFDEGEKNIEFCFENNDFETTLVFSPSILILKKTDKIQIGNLESIQIKRISNNSIFKMHHLPNDTFQINVNEEFLQRDPRDEFIDVESLKSNKTIIETKIKAVELELEKENNTRIIISLNEILKKHNQNIKEINEKIGLLNRNKQPKSNIEFNPVFEKRDMTFEEFTIDRIFQRSLRRYFRDNQNKIGFTDNQEIGYSLFSSARRMLRAINFSIEHLSPHRNSQTRLYINDEHTNDIHDLINKHSLYPIKKNSKAGMFLKKWMETFDIGDDYRIREVEGIASVVEIKESGNYINLVDKGFGAGQIFTILLCIALKIDEKANRYRYMNHRVYESRGESIIMIEEPEANLHPALQSKLTDLFYDAYNEFGIRFIIETHSEYIIRHSQYLSLREGFAGEPFTELLEDKNINYSLNSKISQKYSGNPFKVYYFSKDNDPYEMEYTTDGRFSNNFGPGFFDQATKSTMDTLKLSRKK